jgi:hypothetical protein
MFTNPISELVAAMNIQVGGDARILVRNMAKDYRVLCPLSARVITRDFVIYVGGG